MATLTQEGAAPEELDVDEVEFYKVSMLGNFDEHSSFDVNKRPPTPTHPIHPPTPTQ